MSRVALGQPVTLRLDALPDVQLEGKVEAIAKSVEAKSNTNPSKVVKLKIAIDPTKVPLRPGMRFRGEVATERLPKVVQVPSEAVFVTPAGPVAFRQHGSGVERVAPQARQAVGLGDRGPGGASRRAIGCRGRIPGRGAAP